MMLFLSCEETVELDLDQTEPLYVIEGLITDRPQTQFVRVTRTVDFYADGGSTPIVNALVSVSDGIRTIEFDHNPSQLNGSEGYYFSREPFAGEVGKTYSLRVEVNEEVFTAEDELFRVTDIDSLSVRINEDEFNDPDEPDYFYEILFYTTEPQETKDFYLFKFYRNDTLLLDDENDIYFSNDDLLAEQISGIPTAGYYKRFDTGVVEMYSISNNAFIYYNDLTNLLNNDGGFFGPPPVNPRTNIKGGAVGFFQTSAVVSDTIQILN